MWLQPHRLVFLGRDRNYYQDGAPARLQPRGQRLLSKVPVGHWKTHNFIAGLRCDARDRPLRHSRADPHWRIIETYVETDLDPTFRLGDVVVLEQFAGPTEAPPPSRPLRVMGVGS